VLNLPKKMGFDKYFRLSIKVTTILNKPTHKE
jgi:hypothetical protein